MRTKRDKIITDLTLIDVVIENKWMPLLHNEKKLDETFCPFHFIYQDECKNCPIYEADEDACFDGVLMRGISAVARREKKRPYNGKAIADAVAWVFALKHKLETFL